MNDGRRHLARGGRNPQVGSMIPALANDWLVLITEDISSFVT